MRYVICWGAQSTMDYSYRIKSKQDLIGIIKDIIKKYKPSEGICKRIEMYDSFINELEVNSSFLERNELDSDREIILNGDLLEDLVSQLQDGKSSLGDEYSIDPDMLEKSGGGSPFISAWAGMGIKHNIDYQGFPDVYYTGIMPSNVRKYIGDESNDFFPELYEHTISIDKKPATLSFEFGGKKVMIACKEGRSHTDLDIEQYFGELSAIKRKHPESRIVVALGGLNKASPEEYSMLIERIRERLDGCSPEENRECRIQNPGSTLFFVGTNSFPKKEGAVDYDLVSRFYTQVLKKADIVSFNEQELADVYMALTIGRSSKGALREPEKMTLAWKLRQLPHNGIKVCHAKEGAVLDMNFVPEKILCSRGEISPFIDESIQVAVDGTAYVLSHNPRRNRYPNLTAVKDYSHQIEEEQRNPLFLHEFDKDNCLFDKVPGMHYASGVMIPHLLSRETGAGATFDGILLSMILRFNRINGSYGNEKN